MSVEFSPIESFADLKELSEEWSALAKEGGVGSLFRGPEWLLPWWRAYHRALDASLISFAGYKDGKLVCLAPFYQRVAKRAAVRVREIRLLGDAGPRPSAFDLLCAPGVEEQAGVALGRELMDRSSEWDVIDLQPLRDPSRVRAFFASHLGARGFAVASHETGGARQVALTAAGIDAAVESQEDALVSAYTEDTELLRKGLAAMRRLSRLEWATRDESSPLADMEATQLLEDVTLTLGETGRARLARLDDRAHEAVAVALVVDDDERAVVLALASDPEADAAAERLLTAEARQAAVRGRGALDVVTGAGEYSVPGLPWSRQRAIQLRVYSHSPAATVVRTYSKVNRSVQTALGARGTAAAGARAAWSKIRSAATHVAGRERMHLYRGELWTRGVSVPDGLVLSLLSKERFDAMEAGERSELMDTLELDLERCQEKWARGDLVVYAEIGDRPAGISWCAFGSVFVPELEQTVELEAGDAYIHDVYVSASARGRAVAPSMLEYLARELRQRDLYRAWALIGGDNVASVRAFEKAAYAAVCDVIYTRMGNASRVSVRPPDPEAKRLLGLS